MKKQNTFILLTLLCLAAIAVFLVACGPTTAKTGTAKTAEAAPAQEASQASAQESASTTADIYKMDIKPLTPVDCARCHTTQYTSLKEKGGKHQQLCTNCHEIFHAYNPDKKNWDAIMPKCQGCHDLPHGDDFKDCMTCHQQPHAPKVIQFSKLEQTVTIGKKKVVLCAVCHKKEGEEFAKYPSKHNTEVNCQGCHADKHGYIPSCLDCHDPHIKGQTLQDCLTCHSPHSATHIKQYPEDVPNVFCSACHETEYNNLKNNVTKHSALQCATCHVKHGQIPKCQDCHGEPHGEGLHKRFPNCLDCHRDPHNLPVNKKK